MTPEQSQREAFEKWWKDSCEAPGFLTASRRDIAILSWYKSRQPALVQSPTPSLEQSWAGIRDTMADSLLNEEQKKAFVISILRGRLANPHPQAQATTSPLCHCGHTRHVHGTHYHDNAPPGDHCKCGCFNPTAPKEGDH